MPFFESMLNGGLWSPSIVAAEAEERAIGPMSPTVSAQVCGAAAPQSQQRPRRHTRGRNRLPSLPADAWPHSQNSIDPPALKTDLSNDATALADVRAFLLAGR